MAYQTGKGFVISTKVESAPNTPPGTSGALQIRFNGGAGLALKTAEIQSGEARSDGLSSMGRLGSRSVPGTYNSELVVGGYDVLLEALMRATWVAATVITEVTAGLTSITTTATTIVASAGSWITAGIREGDVIRLTNHSTAGNNSKNLRVKTVSALTITLHGTAPLAANAVADTAFTVTILKKLSNPSLALNRTFYVDEHNQDIDENEVFGNVRWTGFKLTGTPDGMAMIEFTALGISADTASGASSPYYVAPTKPTGTALVFVDALIAINGADNVQCTAFELTYQIQAKTEPVIGSVQSPDVFVNDAKLSGTVSMIRSTLGNLTLRKNETEFALHVLLVEPESEPKDCISFFVPRCKFTDITKALGGDGALIEGAPFMCGKQEGGAASGKDDTLLTICTSAA